MDRVALLGRSSEFGVVGYARSFRERRRGLKGLPEGSAILMKTRSVHGFGVKAPFRAVGLTKTFEVVKIHEVIPWRVVNFPGCRYVLELPMDVEPPLTGETLEMRSV
jgi:hypothetical protein